MFTDMKDSAGIKKIQLTALIQPPAVLRSCKPSELRGDFRKKGYVFISETLIPANSDRKAG
jgi:hypothetical protein